ncbi:MAG: hypothetical protein GX579_15585 [Chloroflexi bacterium]|nr:hypothetical protein [Chloroflexota bacterium]
MKPTLKTIRTVGPIFALVVAVLLLAGCAPGAAEQVDLASAPTFDSVVAVADSADDDQSQAVQVIGAVQSFDGATLRVNGLSVDTSAATFQGAIAEGATVQVQGRQAEGGAIAAEYVWVLQPPTAPTAVPVSSIPFVIEGPVEVISGSRVRIHGLDLELDDDPRLRGLQVGDLLRVGGEVDDDRLDELFDDAIDDDIDDDRYVAVHNTQLGFLSNAIYASDDGRVWRDSGRCADAPPGWAAATEWRTRCSGEFGGGRANSGASTSDVVGPSGGTGSSWSSSSSGQVAPPPPPPPAGGDGSSSSGSWSGSSSGSRSGS